MWEFAWVAAVFGFDGLFFTTIAEDEGPLFTHTNASVVPTLFLLFPLSEKARVMLSMGTK